MLLYPVLDFPIAHGFDFAGWVASHYNSKAVVVDGCHYLRLTHLDSTAYYVQNVCPNGSTPLEQEAILLRRGRYLGLNRVAMSP